MKLLIMPSSINEINSLIDDIDGIIVGLDKLCINMPTNYSKEEIDVIIDICNSHNKEVFISLNKNMFNSDLEYLKEILVYLDSKNITGILYYDIAIVNLKEELSLKCDLVWNQEHLTTNYLTSDFWYDYGSKYTYLSSELTLTEINEIAFKTKAKVIVNVFGYLPMFNSKRHLVKNYLETFNLKDNSKINYIEKEGSKYQILDTNDGSMAYSSKVLNALSESLNMKVDYIVLNSFSITEEDFIKVTKMFKNVTVDTVNEYEKIIDNMFNTDKGFFYKETVYKVKKND